MLARILIVLAALSLFGWCLHTRGYQHGYAQATLEEQAKLVSAEQAARQKEQSFTQQLQKAQQDAKTREIAAQHAAALAQSESVRLRSDNLAIRSRLPELTNAAVRGYAATAGELLSDCAKEYQSVAADADQLANDRETLIAAWPH